ncbi:hypothetical protein ACAX46_004266 [Providencia rettgeri]
MRINDTRYLFNHRDNEDKPDVTKIADINQFQYFLGGKNKKSNKDKKQQSPLRTIDYLKNCFDTLINQGKKEFKDSQREIKYLGEGKLQWRLLNGIMKGCTLYVKWEKKQINIEIYAQGPTFSTLSKIKEHIYKSVSKRYPQYIIEIKVLENAKFS